MKTLARSRYWWPNIDEDIGSICKLCKDCQKFNKVAKIGQKISWRSNSSQFERIHNDYAGPIEGSFFLLALDAQSSFMFVYRTKTETASETLCKLKERFGLVGLPKCIVSDNGPAFRADVFRQYFLNRGVERWNSPVAHPKSNGLVERLVGNFKIHMKLT